MNRFAPEAGETTAELEPAKGVTWYIAGWALFKMLAMYGPGETERTLLVAMLQPESGFIAVCCAPAPVFNASC